MVDFTKLFSTCAEPCSQQRLQDIESNIGMTLPEDYRHIIHTTGGATRLRKALLPGPARCLWIP
ncbi:SMI1/KNR4 family protein [Corynebacterium sp. H128]|uniref:SMI1/KNR4 family protein n=1 Tax=Corynebacterium sp. H128 TaxID=3133427 RepID=UPI00403F59AB